MAKKAAARVASKALELAKEEVYVRIPLRSDLVVALRERAELVGVVYEGARGILDLLTLVDGGLSALASSTTKLVAVAERDAAKIRRAVSRRKRK